MERHGWLDAITEAILRGLVDGEKAASPPTKKETAVQVTSHTAVNQLLNTLLIAWNFSLAYLTRLVELMCVALFNTNTLKSPSNNNTD